MEIDPTPPSDTNISPHFTSVPVPSEMAALSIESTNVDMDENKHTSSPLGKHTPRLDITFPATSNTMQRSSDAEPLQDSNFLGVKAFRRTSSTESFMVKDGLVKVGSDVFLMNYTVIIWDTQPLLANPELFMRLVTETEYRVVVPESVASQLATLAKSGGAAHAEAIAALQNVKRAVSISRRTRIIGKEGLDITTSWSLSADMPKLAPDNDNDIKDITVGIARQQSDIERQMQNLDIANVGDEATPAILVTSESDNYLNERAHSRGVHTAHAARIKSLIKARFIKAIRASSRSRSRSRSRANATTFSIDPV